MIQEEVEELKAENERLRNDASVENVAAMTLKVETVELQMEELRAENETLKQI